jgi:hypothetical protein
MSGHGVYRSEMNEPPDLDEATIEALISGTGGEADPALADLISDVRAAYTTVLPPPSAELSALMGVAQPLTASSGVSRFERMRASTLAKIGAATAALLAATGGLGIAHALPGPVQDAVSHLGIGSSSHHNPDATAAHDSTTTVVATVTSEPTGSTPTTAETSDHHGDVVSGVAHDQSTTGCDHGAAVSQVASDGRSQNDALQAAAASRSCATSTTIAGHPTPPTSVDTSHGEHSDRTTPTSTSPHGDSGDNPSHTGQTSPAAGGSSQQRTH